MSQPNPEHFNVHKAKADPKDFLLYRLAGIDPKVSTGLTRNEIKRPYGFVSKDQLDRGTCTGQASAVANALYQHKDRGVYVDPSAEFAWRMIKLNPKDQFPGTDGSDMRVASETIAQYGTCPEDIMPYQESSIFPVQAPTERQITIAYPNRMTAYARVSTLGEYKYAIDQQLPVLFGLLMTESLYKTQGGVFLFPEDGAQWIGGHAMVGDGYDDQFSTKEGYARVIGSWGKDPVYTDDGWHHIPYSYMFGRFDIGAWMMDAFTFTDLVETPPALNIVASNTPVTIRIEIAGSIVKFVKPVDASPFISMAGHTYLPLRLMVEELKGLIIEGIEWVAQDYTVVVYARKP